MKRSVASLAAISLLTGCAGLSFGPESTNALTYYDPKPYLFISTGADCVSTATIIAVPETRKESRSIPVMARQICPSR